MADYAGLRIGVSADTRQLERDIENAARGAGTSAGQTIGKQLGAGVDKASGTLAASLNKVGIKAGATLGESIGGSLGKTVDAVGKGFGVVMSGVGKVASVGATALGGAAIAATAFGVASFATAARVGELDATLRALAKGDAAVYASMQKTVTAVRKSGIEAGVAQGLVAQFSRNQLDLSKATDLATVAQNSAVIAGRNSTEVLDDLVHGITTQNSLVLRNAGINVQAGAAMDAYAKSVGKSTKDLTDAERAQAVLNAVIEAGGPIAGAYAAAMEEPGKVLRSFPRLFNDIKVSVGKGLVDAFGPLILKAYDFTKALSLALEPGGALAPILKAIGDAAAKLVEPLTKVVSKLTDFVKNLKPEQVKGIADGISKMAGPIASVAAGLATFAGGNLGGGLPIIGKALGALGGPIGTIVVGVGTLVATTPELRTAFGGVLKSLQPLVPLVINFGKQALAGLVPAVKSLMPAIVELGKQLGPILGNAFKSLAPLIPVVVGAFKVFAAGLAPVITAVAAVLKVLLTGPLGTILIALAAAIWLVNVALAANPVGVVVIAIIALVGAIVLLVRNFDVVVNAVKVAWDAVRNAIMTAVNAVIGFLQSYWPVILTVIMGPLGLVLALVIKNFDAIKSAVSSALNAVIGTVTSVWSAVTKAVSSAISAVVGVVSSGFSAVRNVISGAMSAVASTVTGAWATVRNIISSGVSVVVGIVSGFAGAISGALRGVVAAFTAPFEAAWAAVSGIVNRIKGLVDSAVGVVNAGLAPAKALWNAFANTWNSISISLPKIDIPLGPTIGGGSIGLPKLPNLAAGGTVWPQNGGVLAVLAEAGRPERITPLGTDEMTAGERQTVALLEAIRRLLAAGTTVEIDGQAVAAATSAATLFGVAS